eukprot:scaffold32094_cov78-Phaeocystis_antarctica.AAC.1
MPPSFRNLTPFYSVTAQWQTVTLVCRVVIRSPNWSLQSAVSMTSEEARRQAQAEELTLRLADNKTGYYGVSLAKKPGLLKPYQAALKRGGKTVNLGRFATAEEAA